METFKVINPNANFVYMDERLCALKLEETIFDFNDGSCEQYFNVGGLEHTKISKTPRLYKSEEDFKKGVFIHEIYKEVTFGEVLHSCRYEINENDCTAWVYELGAATKIQADKMVSRVICKNYRYTIEGDSLPKYLYKSADSVYNFNDYIFVGEDGNEEIRKSKYGFLLIQDDQRDVFDRFKAILKEMEEKDLKIIWCNEEYKMAVVNHRGVEEIIYEEDINEEFVEDKKILEDIQCRKEQFFDTGWFGYDYRLIAKKGF